MGLRVEQGIRRSSKRILRLVPYESPALKAWGECQFRWRHNERTDDDDKSVRVYPVLIYAVGAAAGRARRMERQQFTLRWRCSSAFARVLETRTQSALASFPSFPARAKIQKGSPRDRPPHRSKMSGRDRGSDGELEK